MILYVDSGHDYYFRKWFTELIEDVYVSKFYMVKEHFSNDEENIS